MNLKEMLNECDELYLSCDYGGLAEKSEEVLEKYPDNE